MTKGNAIKAMKKGKRVTHRFFSDDEWITIMADKETIVDENDTKHFTFWVYREGSAWQEDWSIHSSSS